MVLVHGCESLYRRTGPDGPEILMAGFLLDVSAKLKAHRGQHFCGKIIFAARGEALIEGGAENRRGRRRFDGREKRPAAFAGIRDPPGKAFERWLLQQRDSRKVQQP